MRLTTFFISHFSEKARWALDVAGLAYRERRLLPGPHLLVTRRLSKKSSVPILEHERRVVQGSSAILDYLSSGLGFNLLEPSVRARARSVELEALADRALGLGVQRICYEALLSDREAISQLFALGGPFWARSFYRLTFSRLAPAVRGMYGITSESVLQSKAQFRTAIAVLARELGDKRYFFDDRPTRLDITVAALLAPLCMPPEHPVPWPPLPERVAGFVDELKDSVPFTHTLRMYRGHRAGLST